MVLAGLTFEEVKSILIENGFKIVSNDYWDNHNVIVLKKGDESITLAYEKFYAFPMVVKFLNSLDIKAPEQCQKPYDQWMAQKNK